jgi:hypothetical protein
MPGSVESMAVSNVQSMKAPFGSNKRRAGNTWARAAAVIVGCKRPAKSPGDRFSATAAGPVSDSPVKPRGAKTTPLNCRSKASSAAFLTGGVPGGAETVRGSGGTSARLCAANGA